MEEPLGNAKAGGTETAVLPVDTCTQSYSTTYNCVRSRIFGPPRGGVESDARWNITASRSRQEQMGVKVSRTKAHKRAY